MREFFAKVKNWFSAHRPTKRRLIQLYVALLYNANIKGFVKGRISTAGTKNMCVPGFNCYSCPGAIGSCPLGSLQNALGSSKTSVIAYVLGIIMLFGLILGRTICGFLCPMGLLQDLLYKIKSPKLKKNRVTKALSYFKYVVLAVFVIIMPLIYSRVIVLPAFCQFLCPVGTLAGLGLLTHPTNVGELVSLGVLFTWKFCVLVVILIGSVFIYRLFCRFLCPLGAIYSLFSRFSLLGIKLKQDKCIDCGLCLRTCQVDIKRVGDHECIQCGACVPICPTNAISWKGSQFFVLPNETTVVAEKVDLKEMVAEKGVDNVEKVVASLSETDVDIVCEKKKEKKPYLYPLRKDNGKGFKIIAAVVMIAVLITALVYFNFVLEEETASTTYVVGDVMENFATKEFFSEDGRYELSEDSGKIIVLNFWYITCGGCEIEMPHFGKLAIDEKYSDEVSVVVVHSNDDIFGAEESDTLADGTEVEYLEKYVLEDKGWGTFSNSIKWVMDVVGEESIYLSLGGSGAWPMTAIIDQEGVIRFIAAASVTEETLYGEIEKILAE